MAKAVFIYGLLDPRTGALRYIGKANDAQKRLKSHLRDMKRRTTPVYLWMRELAAEGVAPKIKILDKCCERTWPDREVGQIAKARSEGADLLNVAKGGKEPHCPVAVRRKNGAKNAKNRNKRLWHCKLMLGQALKRGDVSEELKQKMRELGARKPDMFGEWLTI